MIKRSIAFLSFFLITAVPVWSDTGVEVRAIYSKSPALERLIIDLIEHSEELLSLKEELAALAEEVPVAGALDDPRLGVGVANLPTDSFSFDQDPMTQKQLFIAQKFPWFGKLDLRTQRAAIAVERQKALIDVKTQVLVKSLALAFYDLGFVREGLRFNLELTQMVKQMLRVAEAVYASGRGLQQDVFQGQVEVSKLIDEQVSLEGQQRVLVSRINELLNRSDFMPVEKFERFDFLQIDLDPGEMRDLAIRHNPQLRVRQAEIDKALVNIALARKNFYPDMDFKVGYGQRDEGNMGNDQPDFVSASVVVNIPLYQHRKQGRQLTAALKRHRSTTKAYENQQQALPHQVDAILHEIDAIRENYRLFKGGLVQQADLWSRASLAAYEVGKLDFGTMINAHVRRLRFELQAEKYRFEIYKKLTELETVTGTALADIEVTPRKEKTPSGNRSKVVSRRRAAASKAGVN